MATPVIMPKQGQSVETCIITRWFKKKGDKVAAGDILFSYETDKASFDLEAPAEGILLDIFYSDGAEVPVLMNVAVIGAEGEKTEGLAPGGKVISTGKIAELSEGERSQEIRLAEQSDAGNILITEQDKRIRISPRARKLAIEKGIDCKSITGTGPNGRIVANDIMNAGDGRKTIINQASSSPDGYVDQPLSNVRKIIARTIKVVVLIYCFG
jgi:pyruvate dehydrogenase E2 component (dihydrolipoamide acetyltransferase)